MFSCQWCHPPPARSTPSTQQGCLRAAGREGGEEGRASSCARVERRMCEALRTTSEAKKIWVFFDSKHLSCNHALDHNKGYLIWCTTASQYNTLVKYLHNLCGSTHQAVSAVTELIPLFVPP